MCVLWVAEGAFRTANNTTLVIRNEDACFVLETSGDSKSLSDCILLDLSPCISFENAWALASSHKQLALRAYKYTKSGARVFKSREEIHRKAAVSITIVKTKRASLKNTWKSDKEWEKESGRRRERKAGNARDDGRSDRAWVWRIPVSSYFWPCGESSSWESWKSKSRAVSVAVSRWAATFAVSLVVSPPPVWHPVSTSVMSDIICICLLLGNCFDY